MLGKATKKALLCCVVLLGSAGATSIQASAGNLDITISGIVSAKGTIEVAICPPETGFPDCGDKALRITSLPIANGRASGHFPGIPAGSYAISVFHDANANGKLDTFLGIPREGYGFSGNPPFRPRAPRFDEAQIPVSAPETKADIRLRYIF